MKVDLEILAFSLFVAALIALADGVATGWLL